MRRRCCNVGNVEKDDALYGRGRSENEVTRSIDTALTAGLYAIIFRIHDSDDGYDHYHGHRRESKSLD